MSAASVSKTLKIKIISDVHLEFKNNMPTIPPNADVLCLLGDIGNPSCEEYWNFLSIQSSQFKLVLVITGNHEYYGNDIELTNTLMEKQCKKYTNVHFLNNKVVEYNNIVFIGTTLWSHIPKEAEDEVSRYINDYRLISYMSVGRSNNMFNENLAFLKTSIEQYKNKQIIVLTHHAPYDKYTSNPIHDNNLTSRAFSTNLSFLFPYIKAWAYGHTHWNNPDNIIKIEGTDLIANQMGYTEGVKNYNPNFVYELKVDI